MNIQYPVFLIKLIGESILNSNVYVYWEMIKIKLIGEVYHKIWYIEFLQYKAAENWMLTHKTRMAWSFNH